MFTNFSEYKFPKLGYIKIPKVPIPENDKKLLNLNTDSSIDYLAALVKYNFDLKVKSGIIPSNKIDIYFSRVEEEFNEITRLYFHDYILLVYDVIRFCKNNGILNNYARGSCGGSLLLFIIDCIKIDPIKYNLLFERFISSARTDIKEFNGETYIKSESLPDVDIDSQQSKKHLINEYLSKQYPGKTAKIANLSTFQTKVLLKEVFKCYENASEDEAKEISKLIESHFGKIESLDEALKNSKEFAKWEEKHKETIRICKKLYQLNKNKSVHASGIALCENEVEKSIPLELDKDGEIVTGYDMVDCQCNSLKLDSLGLKTLNIIDYCLELVDKKMEDIDINDSSIYQFVNTRNDFYGIFQAEEGLGKKTIQNLKPDNVEILGICNAIGRPGSLSFLDDLTKSRNGGDSKNWGDERINSSLKDTYGVIIYQEQLMRLSKEISGFDSLESNQLRKCITGDTHFISKTRGWISIDRLMIEGYENDLFLVMDENGRQEWKKISKIWSNGEKAVNKVLAKNGCYVNATRWHQFLTDTGWKARNYLNKDDYLVCCRSVDYDGEDRISLELAMVITGIIAEGYFTKENNATFVNHNPELMDVFCLNFEKVFGFKPSVREEYKVAYIFKKEKVQLAQYINYGKSASRRIPDIMMGMTKETTRKFLSFFLTCEGGVCASGCFEVCSKSEILMQQIRLLLLRFGIQPASFYKNDPKYGRFYYLNIQRKRQLILLRDELGCCLESRKMMELNKVIEENDITKFPSAGDMVPASILKEFRLQYGFVFNYTSGAYYNSGIAMESFKEYALESKDKKWINYSNGSQIYSPLKSNEKESCQTKVYDFMVDEDTPYIIANGMVIHNCIAKKDKKKLPELKEKFIQRGIKNGFKEEILEELWKTFNASGDYLFNKCIFNTCYVTTENNIEKQLKDLTLNDKVLAWDTLNQKEHFVTIKHIYHNSVECFKLKLSNGASLTCSAKHKIMTDYGMISLRDIISNYKYGVWKPEILSVVENKPCLTKIIFCKSVGIVDTIDLEVDHPDHNFICQDIVVSNSHSTAYAHTTALTIYLKANHPTEFFLALLKNAKNEAKPIEEITKIIYELPKSNIKLLPPDLILSDLDFTIAGPNEIRSGLGSIKGVSDKSFDKLLKFKNNYSTKFEIFIAAKQAGLNIGVLSALIQAGCMDRFLTQSRCKTVLEAQLWSILTDKEKILCAKFAQEYSFDLLRIIKEFNEIKKDDKNKPLIKDSRFATIKKKYEKYKQIYLQNSKNEELCNWFFEKTLLGFSYSTDLSKIFKQKIPEIITISEAKTKPAGVMLKICGEIEEVKYFTARNEKKTKSLKLKLKDTTDIIDVLLFNDKITENEDLNGEKFEEGQVIVVRGRKQKDSIFAEVAANQCVLIYTKFSELKGEDTEKILTTNQSMVKSSKNT